MRARLIGAEITDRYRRMPGRTPIVTEVTTLGVVGSLTLITDPIEPWRVVPTANGIYFATCSAAAHCPYPPRSAAWPAGAVLPRRQALELALRTFLATPVSVVVVALPTTEPVWVVFERDDVLSGLDRTSALQRISGNLARADPETEEFVRAATRRRIFRPLPILPPPDDTIYAIRLFDL